jgi:hypothetical protein
MRHGRSVLHRPRRITNRRNWRARCLWKPSRLNPFSRSARGERPAPSGQTARSWTAALCGTQASLPREALPESGYRARRGGRLGVKRLGDLDLQGCVWRRPRGRRRRLQPIAHSIRRELALVCLRVGARARVRTCDFWPQRARSGRRSDRILRAHAGRGRGWLERDCLAHYSSSAVTTVRITSLCTCRARELRKPSHLLPVALRAMASALPLRGRSLAGEMRRSAATEIGAAASGCVRGSSCFPQCIFRV